MRCMDVGCRSYREPLSFAGEGSDVLESPVFIAGALSVNFRLTDVIIVGGGPMAVMAGSMTATAVSTCGGSTPS